MSKSTFMDRYVSREHRYSIGTIADTDTMYIAIPVANRLVDYEEYYRIDQGMFDRFIADMDQALDFADRCRRREEDARLIMEPGKDRGSS